VCDDLSADEQMITISNDTRKWGKVVTLVRFEGNTDANLDDFLKSAKKKLGS
jgi:translation initiation factor 1 (eIF-1/SUI1)